MKLTTHEPLSLTDEEFAILSELLESERTRLLVGIRHTDHRLFRDELRHRLEVVEAMVEKCAAVAISAAE
jgi:hypothetical protein